MKTLRNYIGGEWVGPAAADYLDITNPATGEPLGRVPLSGAREVDQAVAAAQTAFLKWREVPPVVRARYLFKLKALMEEQFDDIAATVTRENGKTLDEAKGSVRRGRDRLRIRPPAAGRLRGDHAVQFSGDGAVLVLALRDRDGQHVHPEAQRASPVLPDAYRRVGA